MGANIRFVKIATIKEETMGAYRYPLQALALSWDLHGRSTLERLASAVERGLIDEDMGTALQEAIDFAITLRARSDRSDSQESTTLTDAERAIYPVHSKTLMRFNDLFRCWALCADDNPFVDARGDRS